MDLRTIHLACGQIVGRAGNIERNLEQIRDLSSQAAAVGARLCLFPEGAITGYALTDEVLAHAPTSTGPVAKKLKEIAADCDIVVAAGTMENYDADRYVSHFIAYPDGRLLVQRKHLLNAAETDARLAHGDEERIAFQVDGVQMGVLICADSGIPGIRNKLAAQGCQVCLHPSAGGGARDHMRHPEDLEDPERLEAYIADMEGVCFLGAAMQAAARHHMAIVTVNMSGDDGNDHYHPGHSAIVDSRGRCVVLLPGEYVVDYLEPRVIHAEVVVQTPRVADAL